MNHLHLLVGCRKSERKLRPLRFDVGVLITIMEGTSSVVDGL